MSCVPSTRWVPLVIAAVLVASTAGATASAASAKPPGTTVIGGTPASTDDFPWMIALADPSIARPSGQFCGGTLVAPTKVVTAAHCVARYEHAPQELRLIGGRTDMRTDDGTVRSAVAIWVHPDFVPSELVADVAVVTLDRPMPYRPSPMVLPSDDYLYRPGRAALTLGWGVMSATNPGGTVLQQLHLPLTSDEDCAAQYPPGDPAFPPFIPFAHTCAGYPADDAGIAGGDSGGPLVVAGKLVGITSTRNLAEPTDSAIFTRLRSYAEEVSRQVEGGSQTA